MQRHELEDWLCRFGIAMVFALIIALHWRYQLWDLGVKIWRMMGL